MLSQTDPYTQLPAGADYSVTLRFRDQVQCEQFVKGAVSVGQLLVAIETARDGLRDFGSSLLLRQQLALALVQTGAFETARQLLEELVRQGDKGEETLSLMGRIYKELWRYESDGDQAHRALDQSIEFYGEAYARYRTYYPGINLAFGYSMRSQRTEAEQCAREVAELCRIQISAHGDNSDGWVLASLGEAQVHLGELAAAHSSYSRAAQLFHGRWRDISSMRRQVRELLSRLGPDPTAADDCFELPRVIVFTGHMLDQPGRTPPRFPPECETKVREQIAQFLDQERPGFGYCSAACGGDILFCEALLQRAAEVHLVLPCPAEAFKRVSVKFAGPEWERRFEKVLAGATTCSIANPAEAVVSDRTRLSPIGYVYANRIMTGLALLQARALDLELRTLAVWDGRAGDDPGGTSSVVAEWVAHHQPPHIIQPGEGESLLLAKPTTPIHQPDSVGLIISEMQQDIKAILFADVAGYSHLTESQVRPFVTELMGAVSRLIVKASPPPIVMQTWGDSLYFIFDRLCTAASFSVKLRDLIVTTAWDKHGLPADLSIRIALHAGPVFACVHPVMRQFTFTGAHVTRAARIEPVTARAQIYTSQEFAALCVTEGDTEFAFEYLGQLPTAKKFGHAPLYRLCSKRLI